MVGSGILHGRSHGVLGLALASVACGPTTISSPLSARQAAPASKLPVSPAALAFHGVTVIDVTDGRRLPDQTVVVVGNRVETVGAAGKVRVPKGSQVVEAKGKYIIPGLWDMHTHPRRLARIFYPFFIAHGVTGIRDAWSEVPLDTLVLWRREILASTRVGPPRQILSGPAINERRQCMSTRRPVGQTCVADSADAIYLVDSLHAAGADMIKTYDLTRRMYLIIGAEARRQGIPFGGHIHAPDLTAQEASDSGASIIDHPNTSGGVGRLCWWRGTASVEQCQRVAEEFRRNGTWWTPTLMRFEVEYSSAAGPRSRPVYAHFRERVAQFWSDSALNSLASNNAVVNRGGPFEVPYIPPSASPTDSDGCMNTDSDGCMNIAQHVGLPILAGTDAGAPVLTRMPPGLSLHAELQMYVAEGMTPLTALQTATLNPAKFLHGTDSLGTVAPGKLADFLLLDADPLADIANTMAIRAVVANGRYFDRAALDQLLAEAKAQVLRTPDP